MDKLIINSFGDSKDLIISKTVLRKSKVEKLIQSDFKTNYNTTSRSCDPDQRTAKG
jgi:hypothetical protein